MGLQLWRDERIDGRTVRLADQVWIRRAIQRLCRLAELTLLSPVSDNDTSVYPTDPDTSQPATCPWISAIRRVALESVSVTVGPRPFTNVYCNNPELSPVPVGKLGFVLGMVVGRLRAVRWVLLQVRT